MDTKPWYKMRSPPLLKPILASILTAFSQPIFTRSQMNFLQVPRVAPAVFSRRQEVFNRMWQLAISENPNQSEEGVLQVYTRKAYTAVMEQYNATSQVFEGPYLTEQDILRIVRQQVSFSPLSFLLFLYISPACPRITPISGL